MVYCFFHACPVGSFPSGLDGSHVGRGDPWTFRTVTLYTRCQSHRKCGHPAVGRHGPGKKRIEQLTGERAVYTRMPECAFEIGEFKVERYGPLVFTEEADADVIDTLLAEGLIRAYKPEETTDEEDVEEQDAEADEASEEPVEVTISLPIVNHTATSLRNLAAMIRARGNLISKATGGQFSCTAELMEAINTATDIPTIKGILDENSGSLDGLVIEEDRSRITQISYRLMTAGSWRGFSRMKVSPVLRRRPDRSSMP